MNYRHAFHAGNHADVLKHVVLLALIDALRRKEAPFFVLDTHAGRGQYALASNEHRKTGESDGGVLRLFDAPPAPAPIERYLKAVAAHNVPGRLQVYPGSPMLVADALRAQDRMAACELQPDEAAALKTLFHGNAQVAAHARDGYDAVSALLPPRVDATRFARGLVLIDPPYESQQAEFPRILDALAAGLAQWPQGIFAVWYPIKQRKLILHFLRKAALLPAKSALVVELLVRPDDSPLRLNGSGMLVLNPPWRFDAAIKPSLVALGAAMADGVPSTRLDWLRREDGAVEAPPPPRARDLHAASGSARGASTTRAPGTNAPRGVDRRGPDHRSVSASASNAPASRSAGTARPDATRAPAVRPAARNATARSDSPRPSPARPSARPGTTGKRPPKRTP